MRLATLALLAVLLLPAAVAQGPAPLTITSLAANPAVTTAPAVVSWHAVVEGGTPPYAYEWDLGEAGATSTEEVPTLHYVKGGLFTATLEVRDAGGQEAIATGQVDVAPELLVDARSDWQGGRMPATVRFEATATGGTPPYTYRWDFGPDRTGDGAHATHRYENPGVFVATVMVEDARGALAWDEVQVISDPPFPFGVPGPGGLVALAGLAAAAVLLATARRRAP